MDLQFAKRLEYVLGAAWPTRAALDQLCTRAKEGGCRAVVLPSGGIVLASHFLEGVDVKTICRVGCASGSMDSDAKRYEAELAIDLGAHEIELVPSLARIQDADYKAVLREIRDVVESADERPVRVAFEPGSWDAAILEEFVQVVLDSGAQYLCTSQKTTTELDEVARLRALCGEQFGIVARIEQIDEAEKALRAGANLIALLDRP